MEPKKWSIQTLRRPSVQPPRIQRVAHAAEIYTQSRVYGFTRRWNRAPCMRTFFFDSLHPAHHCFPLPASCLMVTLRVVRHDREQVLAECQSVVIPTSGEVLQLDTTNETGEKVRPSTMWRVVAVTLHVPSLASSKPQNGAPLAVQHVEVAVLPDVSLVPEFAAAAEKILSESKM
jgi:hypothetical protein